MKTYEMPELEIEIFEVEDIITTSSYDTPINQFLSIPPARCRGISLSATVPKGIVYTENRRTL